jgi:hypothetical protein
VLEGDAGPFGAVAAAAAGAGALPLAVACDAVTVVDDCVGWDCDCEGPADDAGGTPFGCDDEAVVAIAVCGCRKTLGQGQQDAVCEAALQLVKLALSGELVNRYRRENRG